MGIESSAGQASLSGSKMQMRMLGVARVMFVSEAVLFLLPGLVYLLVFFLAPLVGMVGLSVFDPTPTLRNYAQVFEVPAYLMVLRNSMMTAGVVTICTLVLGYPIAYFLKTTTATRRNLIMTVIMLPYFTSVLVRTFAWMVLLGSNGIINHTLQNLGIISSPLPLMYNSLGVFIAMVHLELPRMVLCIYTVMVGIDDRLIKVARTLGAGRMRAFVDVFLPLSLPGVAAGMMLVFIISTGYFITPALMGGLENTMITQVIGTEVTSLLNWSFASALAVILLIVTLVLLAIANLFVPINRIWMGIGAASSGSAAPAAAVSSVRARAFSVSSMTNSLFALGYQAQEWTESVWRRILPQQWHPKNKTYARPDADVFSGILSGAVSLIGFLSVAPILIVVIISFSSERYLIFPPPGFSLAQYIAYVNDQTWVRATITSFEVGFLAAIIATILGVGMAYGIVRGQFRFKEIILGFLLSPLIVPTVISAIAIYFLLVKFQLAGNIWGLTLGHVVIALPYVVIVTSASLQGVDPNLERAAMNLGASRLKAILSVTLPLIRPGIFVAALLAFLTSFDDVVYALFLGIGMVTTLPLRMFDGVKQDVTPVISAVATLQIALVLFLFLAMELQRRFSKAPTGTSA